MFPTNRMTVPSPHPDPLTGAPGAHPVGAGFGAAVGGAAAGVALGTAGAVATGSAVGAVAGPLGAVVGALAGGLAGGVFGHHVAESMHPTVLEAIEADEEPAFQEEEEAFWHERYLLLPYVLADKTFADYLPAFRYGRQCREQFDGRSFSEVELQLHAGWIAARGDSSLDWEDARCAIRDAYEGPMPPPATTEDIAIDDDDWVVPPM